MNISELLEESARVVRTALEEMLPTLSTSWWTECVKNKLSFKQCQFAEKSGIDRLDSHSAHLEGNIFEFIS